MYGFSSNLMEHMAIKTLQPDAEIRFSLEDVFAEGAAGAERLAWVSGWRRLPHMTQQVQQLYEYPQQFAEQIFERIVQALRRRAPDGEAQAARTGRMFIVTGEEATTSAAAIADLQAEYILSSDAQVVAANQARHCDQARLLRDRHEGEFILSYETPGGWTAITKDILTEVLGAGRDAKVTNLPGAAAAALRVTCAGVCA
jgi:formyltetrahydrofolate synthetase